MHCVRASVALVKPSVNPLLYSSYPAFQNSSGCLEDLVPGVLVKLSLTWAHFQFLIKKFEPLNILLLLVEVIDKGGGDWRWRERR